MRNQRPFILVFVAIACLTLTAYVTRGTWRSLVDAATRPSLPVATAFQVNRVMTTSSRAMGSATSSSIDPFTFAGKRPAQVNLAVPFMVQAPKQNWAMPYQEACEEASLLMVQGYMQGKTNDFTPNEADRLLLALLKVETDQWLGPDISLATLARLAQSQEGVHPVVKTLATIDDIKNALANGYPVILPASGKDLHNPNFHNGGPAYHMLVIKGYVADGRMITNDPGTRNGKDYIYSANVLFAATHDWNNGDVEHGAALGLALMPK